MTNPPRLAAAFALLALGFAAAAETSPYYIGGSVGYTHLSNALGLADGDPVPAGLGYVSKSDNVTSIALIGGLDQPISRQRLFGDVTLRRNHFARNDLLSNTSYAATLGLDWQTIERISGNLTLKANRDLVRFGTFEQPTGTRNLVSSRQADFTARIGVVTRFTFEGGAGYRSIDYSDPIYASRDFSQSFLTVGMRYWPSEKNYAGLGLREGRGRYPHVTEFDGTVHADRFDRRDVDAYAYLRYSNASSVFVRASHTRIDQEINDRLDFSGFTGLLRGTWYPTIKLRLVAELARDRAQEIQFNDFDTGIRVESGRLATIGRLRGELELTAKTALHAGAMRSRRSITQVDPANAAAGEGRETGTQVTLGASWTPTRTSLLSCDLSRDRRRADLASADRLNIASNSVGCSAQLTLQP